MKRYAETPVVFELAGEPMLGICTAPAEPADTAEHGVLVLVGGPQYRVGSHRQFVLLARSLASHGIAVMRFDFCGTGDSGGPDRGFEGRDEEIRAALDAFLATVPNLRRVALWGLCDAASAALFYAPTDARIAGLALLNPWVRSEVGLAQTQLKHYYGARLRDPDFWRKLASGRMNLGAAIGGWIDAVRRSVRRGTGAARDEYGAQSSFQARMAEGWRKFSGSILLIVSGVDLTAKEFLDHAAADPGWRGLVDAPRVCRCDFAEADHTFSSAHWRNQVAVRTAQWIRSLEQAPA